MISYEKALKIMRQNIKVSKKTERINIQNSHMRIISKEILSKFNYPRNNTSAMDGIVIFKSELRKNKILKIVGESKAGNKSCSSFKKNEAKFIYTGAPIPGLNKIVIPKENYIYINDYCKRKEIDWFASCWDLESLKFIRSFNPVAYKIASASLTDQKLLKEHAMLDKPIILSTGMSTMKEIRKAEQILSDTNLLIAHSTSAYPCKSEELNLNVIPTLMKEFNHPIGYSGHELGIQTTLAACVLGACFIERHFTLDRSMWGTDQAASLEPPGLKKLIRDIRVLEKSLGDGVKKVYDSEKLILNKLRLSLIHI